LKKAFGNLLRIMVLATILSLAGLVMSGAVMAWPCKVSHDGTVTDKVSGLMWQQETAGPMNWDAAMNYAAGLNLGGKTGWRLPTKEELVGLYLSPCKVRMSVGDCYWSSTLHAPDTSYAWIVNFSIGLGSTNVKPRRYFVRAVRPGQ